MSNTDNTNLKVSLEHEVLGLIPQNLTMINHLSSLYSIITGIGFSNPAEYTCRVSVGGEFVCLIGSLSSGLNGIINAINCYVRGQLSRDGLNQLQDAIKTNQFLVSVQFTLPVCAGLVKDTQKGKEINSDQHQFLVKFFCQALNHEFQD